MQKQNDGNPLNLEFRNVLELPEERRSTGSGRRQAYVSLTDGCREAVRGVSPGCALDLACRRWHLRGNLDCCKYESGRDDDSSDVGSVHVFVELALSCYRA